MIMNLDLDVLENEIEAEIDRYLDVSPLKTRSRCEAVL